MPDPQLESVQAGDMTAGFRPISREPPPFLPASVAFLPPGTPSTSIAKADTPRSVTPKGSSRGHRTSRSTLSSRMSRRRVDDGQHKSRSELARETPDARIEMTAAMQTLFNTFDMDGSGSIDLDEFVKVQGIASRLYGKAPGAALKQELVEQYLQARAPGEVQLYGGGLGFEGFVRWQLQWQAPFWVTGEEMEISERCKKLGEHIKSKRSSSNSSRSQRPRPRSSRPRSPWPPQAPSSKAAPPRPPRSARKYVSGGGMATAAKGFVQPPPEVAFDIDTYEDERNLKEDSSDDEAYRQKKLAEAASVEEEAEELRFIAKTDVRANVLAKRLHIARLHFLEALVPSQREACRAKEKEILEEMQRLVTSLVERRVGEMVLRGSVVCGQAVLQSSTLELQDVASGSLVATTKSSNEGIFKLSSAVSPQKGGSNHLLVTRHRGAAPLYRKMSGEGLQRCRLDLLPLHAWYYQADSSEPIVFEDKESGASFRIPPLVKAGQSFTGKVKLTYGVVRPDFGSMSCPVIKLKRRDNAIDAAQAEASRVAAMAAAAVPERHGRSLAGSQVPLLLTVAVFVRLYDAEDGQELDVQDRKVEVFLPSHSLALEALEVGHPSLWSFSDEHAEWCQTPHLLFANNKELPLPRQPEAEIRHLLAKSTAQASRPDAAAGCRAEQESVQVAEIRRGHEAWIRQQRREPQAHLEGVCYCGFRSKEAILLHLRRHRKDLHFADPPKRLFAGVQPDETGFHQSFPCRTADDIAASAERAALHPEVVVSHHLTAASRLLDPAPEIAEDLCLSPASLFTFRHYDQISGRVLPHLRHLANFLVDGARAIHSVKGDALVQVAKSAIKMAALEFMVNCWIRPRKANSAPCTIQELWEALKVRGGDVATAFLYVALQQANRDSLASLRKQLRHRNPSLWASYHELLPALHGESLEKLVKALKGRADVQALQDMVREQGGTCRRASLSAALAELPRRVAAARQRHAELTERRREAKAVTEKASKGWAVSMKNLKNALMNNDLSQQLDEGKATKELAALAKSKKEEAAKLKEQALAAEQEAEMEQSMKAPASRLAQDQSRADEILQSDDPEEAWKEVLSGVSPALWEYGYPKALTFSFEVPRLGQWHALGMAEAPEVPLEESKSKELSQFDLNFFSELPIPQQPVLRASAMALGIFDGHEAKMVAVEVASASIGSSSMSWSQVEADGTFCIFVSAFRSFELWVTMSDTSRPPLRFGPFTARSCDEVTHLGTLRPSYATKPGEWRKPVLPAGAFIMLPRVEIGGTSHERCSCDAQAFLEGTETSTDELSKELSKELSRQDASIEA